MEAMVKHIVMWRLRDSAEGVSKEENAVKLKTRLEALPAEIPELEFAQAGINFCADPAAFDVVLYAEFKDKAALATYQAHPAHLRLIEFLAKIRTDKGVVDYEIQEVV